MPKDCTCCRVKCRKLYQGRNASPPYKGFRRFSLQGIICDIGSRAGLREADGVGTDKGMNFCQSCLSVTSGKYGGKLLKKKKDVSELSDSEPDDDPAPEYRRRRVSSTDLTAPFSLPDRPVAARSLSPAKRALRRTQSAETLEVTKMLKKKHAAQDAAFDAVHDAPLVPLDASIFERYGAQLQQLKEDREADALEWASAAAESAKIQAAPLLTKFTNPIVLARFGALGQPAVAKEALGRLSSAENAAAERSLLADSEVSSHGPQMDDAGYDASDFSFDFSGKNLVLPTALDDWGGESSGESPSAG